MKNIIYEMIPITKEKMWAGENLSKSFNYDNNVGEIWLFSSITEGDNKVHYKNSEILLSELFNTNHSIFNTNKPALEMQLRIVDAGEKLSVQVHPLESGNVKGNPPISKNEAWYFLKTKKNSDIIVGTKLKTKNEVIECLNNNNIDMYLNKYQFQQNEFVQIDSGTIHAIGAGNFIIEISDPSNTTYRFYDYDRVDKNGDYRELHINQALDNIKLEDKLSTTHISQTISENMILRSFNTNSNYILKEITFNGEIRLPLTEIYSVLVLIEGYAQVESDKLKIYTSYLVSAQNDLVVLNGNGKLLLASEVNERII